MDNKSTSGCGGGCSSCSSSCDTEKSSMSFFDRLDNISEHLQEVGEENILKILNETIEEWEKEDAEEDSKKSE